MSRFRIASIGFVAIGAAIAAIAPSVARPALLSGVDKGESLPAYHPTHVTGPDKNTGTCPVCKYPRNPAVQAWINTDDDRNVTALASALEKAARRHSDRKLKVFVVFMNPKREAGETLARRLARIGAEAKLEHVSLAYLPGPDDEAIKGYAINTDSKVRNTIFVYKNRTVDSKFVNLTADAKGVTQLGEAVSKVL